MGYFSWAPALMLRPQQHEILTKAATLVQEVTWPRPWRVRRMRLSSAAWGISPWQNILVLENTVGLLPIFSAVTHTCPPFEDQAFQIPPPRPPGVAFVLRAQREPILRAHCSVQVDGLHRAAAERKIWPGSTRLSWGVLWLISDVCQGQGGRWTMGLPIYFWCAPQGFGCTGAIS